MKKRIISFEYTCSVCGKGMGKNESPVIVTMPTIIDREDGGQWDGRVEWHLHAGACVNDFIESVGGNFTPQYIYPGCGVEDR